MADTGDAGSFSDDEFDALASDDLLALEDEAVQKLPDTTSGYQRGLAELPQGPERPHIGTAEHGGRYSAYEDPDGQEEAYEAPTLDVGKQPLAPQSRFLHGSKPVSEATQREQWRLNRFGAPNSSGLQAQVRNELSLPHRNSGPAHGRPSSAILTAPQSNSTSKLDSGLSDVERLQAELQKLRIEKEGLEHAVKTANNQLLAKTGEVSIIRSNQVKATKDFEKRIEEILKQHQTENERHRVEIEQARKDREKLVTHNQFLDHEMNDQAWQLRRAQKSMKLGEKAGQAKNDTTPKKNKPVPFGDGFNEDEVTVISPSKTAGKAKATTPKAGSKRKRDVPGESPVKTLEFTQPVDGVSFEADNLLNVAGKYNADAAKKDDGRFKFLQLLLDRRIARHEKRTFEILTDYMFPSDQRSTLSSLFIDRMTPLSTKQDVGSFPTAVGDIILSLWSRCLQEDFHEPIRYLLDIIQLILFEGSTAVASSLMDELVDLTQRTADINIIPRYKRFKRRRAITDVDLRPLSPNIDTQVCLQLLDLTTTLCIRDPDLIKRFWRSMRFDFLSMLLRSSQDLDDIMLTVRLLTTSVRTDSFAMIVARPASQSSSEQHVIDRLSSMLIEIPRTAEGEDPHPPLDIARMRLEILALIEAMVEVPYCGSAFATHPSALSRLVRVMHDELNNLYEYRYGHELRAELVNQSTRLLYQLTTEYADSVGDLQEKLRAPPTSVYKHLIVLSRLAFSEGTYLEADIEEDVLDAAHQMLEELVTPEEGEALQRAFVREER